ncbi:MAG: flavodoxin, partial [Ruminococcus sp.]|nr:flavodoxin [Ruminococcus sp.]
DYDRIAFGCSAMGAEVLEEDEFEPFFTSIEASLSGKTIALFGSYGWGDGEWMRNWEERVKEDGVVLFGDEGLIVNETPSNDDLAKCKEFGENLIK